jgi:hypothetical protein
MHKAQRLINHVALVLDASWSMKHLKRSVVKVADEQIKHLAKRSEELSQETRVSIYYFGEKTIECLIFDMDVMRLPSIADLYDVLYENTSLIDATLKSQEDLATTSQLYGDHAFLSFILTDGQENRSRRSKTELRNYIQRMSDNWSMGFLVPDQRGVEWMENLGVLRESVAIWDTTSSAGLDIAASSIRTATDNFMTQRAKGVRGTRSVFSTGTEAVNPQTVQNNLKYLNGVKKYLVHEDTRIDEFCKSYLGYYNAGMGYYQLTKTETIQPQKKILVVDKSNGNVYGGDAARQLVGLPAMTVRVKPDHNPKYDIFVQSTSLNRKLLAGTKVLVP